MQYTILDTGGGGAAWCASRRVPGREVARRCSRDQQSLSFLSHRVISLLQERCWLRLIIGRSSLLQCCCCQHVSGVGRLLLVQLAVRPFSWNQKDLECFAFLSLKLVAVQQSRASDVSRVKLFESFVLSDFLCDRYLKKYDLWLGLAVLYFYLQLCLVLRNCLGSGCYLNCSTICCTILLV